MIKFMAKGANLHKNSLQALTTPLSKGEFLFRPGRGEIHQLIEGKILNYHLFLRQNLAVLDTACAMIKSLSSSQLLGKPAPKLYQLFLCYLRHLPSMKAPRNLLNSFYLKILRHDGLILFKNHCTRCSKSLTSTYVVQGESFCQKHAENKRFEFSQEESYLLQILSSCRTISQIKDLVLENIFEEKIHLLFRDIIGK